MTRVTWAVTCNAPGCSARAASPETSHLSCCRDFERQGWTIAIERGPDAVDHCPNHCACVAANCHHQVAAARFAEGA